MLFAFFALKFAFTWKDEQEEKRLVDFLLTEAGMLRLFQSYHLSSVRNGGNFSSHDLFEAVRDSGELEQRWFVKFLPKRVVKKLSAHWHFRRVSTVFARDQVLAQQATDLILSKLGERRALEFIESGSIVREFRLGAAARKQLFPTAPDLTALDSTVPF